jgi:hypothetical protein
LIENKNGEWARTSSSDASQNNVEINKKKRDGECGLLSWSTNL